MKIYAFACLVVNPIMVDKYAAFFNCTPMGQASDSIIAPTFERAIHFSWLGPEIPVCCLAHWGSIGGFHLFLIIAYLYLFRVSRYALLA